MKTFAEAQQKAVALAEQGDITGIDRLMEELLSSGAEPVLVSLLGTYRESALFNLGKKR